MSYKNIGKSSEPAELKNGHVLPLDMKLPAEFEFELMIKRNGGFKVSFIFYILTLLTIFYDVYSSYIFF